MGKDIKKQKDTRKEKEANAMIAILVILTIVAALL